MGANFKTQSFDGKLSKKELETAFERVQDQDRYENGHSYSGGFGMARGLQIADKTFRDREIAEEYLDSNCEKWEEAIAVVYTDKDGAKKWLIGAVCAS
ncbi:hypothetical protein X766_16015 [Mesorhizobium sp. LSJC255A00]|uniref:hypothetical protein n=1 Tax=Mesorhizobium sp. LSJC255A00 TaxID=1287313 RepID=UPI0003CF994F|nr:hypothetical protein [Mesorhizobium sp. LSJC255A00]ESX17895.1 hypothetical protein X766_16015 [Mesorhizobium sp. LSJC255A00]